LRDSETNWIAALKWVLVLPMFVLSFFFLRTFARMFVIRMLIDPIANDRFQLKFVLTHLYDQLFCVAFSIYAACVLAPKRRVTISILLGVFALLTVPKRLEIAKEANYYGELPWKQPYLIAVLVAGALIPIAIMVVRHYKEKRTKKQDGGVPAQPVR